MSGSDSNSAQDREDGVDLERRDVLAALAKYSATVAAASTVVLSASASVSVASVSGMGGQNPGNSKPVGEAPFGGTRGEVPSGRPRDIPSRKPPEAGASRKPPEAGAGRRS